MYNFETCKRLPKNSLIIQVGPYPPPYGGISMHIKRLSKLINTTGTKCIVFSPRQQLSLSNSISYRQLLKLIIKNSLRKSKLKLLVHLHHRGLQTFRVKWYGFIFLVKLCKGKVVVNIGSLRHDLKKITLYKKFWFKRITAQIDRYVVVASHIKENMLLAGCPNEKIAIIPGFIPPDEKEISSSASIPQDLDHFLLSHQPIIVANSSGVVFHNGRDLYGLDMCIELTKRLINLYPKLGFIYAIAPGGHGPVDDWDYLNKMRKNCQFFGIESQFYFRICSGPFTPILKRSHILVRPTSTDGDSVSIREAFYLRKPVIASNVVSRPNGCLIFKDNDIDDFYDKVNHILTNYRLHKQLTNKMQLSFSHNELFSLYEKILQT